MPTQLPADLSLDGLNFTRAQEGRALRAYQDSVGVWTIGYGLTNFDKNLPWKIVKGLTITEAQAEWYLVKSLRENYLPAAKRALEGGTYAHPQGALDGACDFHFNTGGVLKASWPAALGRGDLANAEAILMSWNKAGGRVLNGLTRRRAGNWLEMSAGDYGHLAGPGIIEPRLGDNQEVQTGTGDVLTAFPADPGDASAGNVKTTGIPKSDTNAPGVLAEGMTGPAVEDAQNALTAAGYPTVASGVYDDLTIAQVHSFQRAHPDLTDDGKIGPATRAALARAAALRGVTGKLVKTAAPSLPALYIGFHQWVSAHAGNIAVGAAAAFFGTIAAYLLWKHRRDVAQWINAKLGRNVL